jgi:hypothetical protein
MDASDNDGGSLITGTVVRVGLLRLRLWCRLSVEPYDVQSTIAEGECDISISMSPYP